MTRLTELANNGADNRSKPIPHNGIKIKRYNSREYLAAALKTKNYLETAKENGISKTTIQRKLNYFTLTKKRWKWTSKELRKLGKNYSLETVYALFPDRTKCSINHKASRLGLKRKFRAKKYRVNELFFDNWTHGSAYVLGWMFSDGNVSKEHTSLGFHLQSRDAEVLRKIRKAMRSNHKIVVKRGVASFYIYNRKMCERLVAIGCGPNKTRKIDLPSMPEKYLNHFVRGYFDGGGSIMFNYPNTIKIKLYGYRKFLKNLSEKISRTLRIRASKVKKQKHGNVWFIHYYGNTARKVCFWLYKTAGNLYLKRKRKRFQKHIRLRNARCFA